jgi:hypothetical protein
MPPSRGKVERLSAPRYVTIVLRFLVNRQVRLVHGEVAGVEGVEPPRRFRGWRQLLRAIRALLADARRDDAGGGDSAAGGV